MTRQQFILEARTWIGVPWRHQGRTRQGIDCVGLLVRVAQDCGMDAIDVTSYRRMGESQQLKALCEQQLLPITDYRPGDLLRMVTDTHGQHMGLVTDHPEGSACCTPRRCFARWSSTASTSTG